MRRIVLLLAVTLLVAPSSGARADDLGGDGFAVPTYSPQPVSAPPPPYVELESRQVAAGVGFAWGSGSLSFEGRNHAFDVKGLRLGDVGIARLIGEGEVRNLASLDQFAGRYAAAEIGAAIGKGASRLVLRNEHGVVIHLQTDLTGVALTLGATAFEIGLR